MRLRVLLATVVAVLVTLTLSVPASAATPPDNPWLQRRVMNMAHSGGEDEAPMNTMYAFKRAVRLGADDLELDVQSTKDGHVVVIHNATVDQTTNGHGYVVDKTLGQIKQLDAAYWFVPGHSAQHGQPASAYTLRGARHGHPQVPGYQNKDFEIPTLKNVLHRFPNTPINIEIKGTSDSDVASYKRTAKLLAQLLNKVGRTDVIVTSFNDEALAYFHSLAPQIPLAPGQNELLQYFLFGVKPMDGTVALQVPVTYSGIQVVSKEFVARAHADGYAVHVWFSGTAPDDAATYNAMIDDCVDGLMAARPTLLESILDARGIERPGRPGVDPCAA